MGVGYQPEANPQPGRPGVTLCLVSTLRPVRHWWLYQEYKTPVDIAVGVTKIHKSSHQDNLVTP